MSDPLYHIATPEDWSRRERHYVPAPFGRDGFVHCSTASQIPGVAERFFRGQANVVLLKLDPERITAEIRWENLEGGRELFPHVYGPLNLGAVVSHRRARVHDDGRLELAPD